MHVSRTFSSRALTPLLGLTLLAALGPARAATLITYGLTYSGVTFGNTAVANGTITLDTSKINNPGATIANASPFVTAFSLTVSGASSGNGTFGLSNYNPANGSLGFFLDTNGGTLDFTKPLIGQPTSGTPFGTTQNGTSGDFNFFANSVGATAGATTGATNFQITTNNGNGQSLRLTNFSPQASVGASSPEPSSWALLGFTGLGALGLMWRARRRRVAVGA